MSKPLGIVQCPWCLRHYQVDRPPESPVSKAERAVVRAAIAGRLCVKTHAELCDCEFRLAKACDRLLAARAKARKGVAR